jgi:ParB-like chromosome segregation protein Spo0J
MRPLAELTPWADNPRVNDAAAERLAHTILTHGWTNPILLDKTGQIVAGHTRLKAAIKLGLTEVPTITLDVEGPEAIALAIADNRLAEFAEWDDSALAKLLEGLADDDFDLGALGYDDDEFAALLNGDAEAVYEEGDAPVDDLDVELGVLVACSSETEQRAILDRLQAEGLSCRAIM